jgi:hypothetical protein
MDLQPNTIQETGTGVDVSAVSSSQYTENTTTTHGIFGAAYSEQSATLEPALSSSPPPAAEDVNLPPGVPRIIELEDDEEVSATASDTSDTQLDTLSGLSLDCGCCCDYADAFTMNPDCDNYSCLETLAIQQSVEPDTHASPTSQTHSDASSDEPLRRPYTPVSDDVVPRIPSYPPSSANIAQPPADETGISRWLTPEGMCFHSNHHFLQLLTESRISAMGSTHRPARPTATHISVQRCITPSPRCPWQEGANARRC